MIFFKAFTNLWGRGGLIISIGVGCGIVMNFDGSLLGLMVFLIYLGEMLKSRQGMGTLQGRDRTGNKSSSKGRDREGGTGDFD